MRTHTHLGKATVEEGEVKYEYQVQQIKKNRCTMSALTVRQIDKDK